MKADPGIEEIRAARREISESCGHDPKRLVRFYEDFTAEMKKTGRYRFSSPRQAPKRGDRLAGAGVKRLGFPSQAE